MTAIRTRQWKYITYPLDPELSEELYHLRYDPDELFNRIVEPQYTEITEQLRGQLQQLQQQTGFRLPEELDDELTWQ